MPYIFRPRTTFIKTHNKYAISSLLHQSVTNARGGVQETAEYDDEEESEEEEEEEEFYDAVEALDEETSDESDLEENKDEVSTERIQIEVNVNKFDEPFVQSPMSGLMVSLGVLYLSRKVNLFSPTCVRAARWGFVCYLVMLQALVLYFRIQAKKQNDRTPIDLQNPLFTILENKLSPQAQDKSNDVVKNIASSFLSNKSTILEYDLQQTRSMQSGILISILLQWVLHFKFEQIQPLIMASLNGLLALVYSPLFQVYILGKNLERPFKSPMMRPTESASTSAPASNKLAYENADDEDGEECDEDDTLYTEDVSLVEEEESTIEDAVEDET